MTLFNQVRYISYRVLIRTYPQSRLSKTTGRVSVYSRSNHKHHSCILITSTFRKTIRNFSKDRQTKNGDNLQPSEANHELVIRNLQTDYKELLSLDTPPLEKHAENFLLGCKNLAQNLLRDFDDSIISRAETPSALYTLDNSQPEKKICKPSQDLKQITQSISDISHSFIKHPSVFISPELLKIYVTVQASLGRPETLPEAFYLYSHKPVPLKNSSPVSYSESNPSSFKNVIPQEIAKSALEVAIKAKNLVSALDIIEAAYNNKAFRYSKIFRKVLLPSLIMPIISCAIYTLALQLSLWQTSMDTNLATNVAFMGMMAYVALTGTIGFVAITTSNDQMDRVTWAPGVPLRQRWMREEERAAIDRVVCAWGFRENWRRGEEEGEEWDLLKEWIGRRAMVLDKVELMEGMN